MDTEQKGRLNAFIWASLAIAGIFSQPYFGQISFGLAWTGDVINAVSLFILGWVISSKR